MNVPSGFEAFLRRTYPQEFADEVRQEKQVTPQELKDTGDALFNDAIVIDVKGSSSISRLKYTRKKMVLETTYTSGKTYSFEGVSYEEFQAVAHPGKEFENSVGKAHHAIIASRLKRR